MKIKALHQIEITSRCNLRCVYCPHPKMKRDKVDMDDDTFWKSLRWVRYFSQNFGQTEVNLAGIGESTLHPSFEQYVQWAREYLIDMKLVLATNGIEITKRPELAELLAYYDVKVFVSAHRPEKAGLAVSILNEAGCLSGISFDPSFNSVDWAGQVDWPVMSSAVGHSCKWQSDGWVIALSNGDVVPCSFDAEAVGKICTVDDDLREFETKPYSLCETCHFKVDKNELKIA